MATFYIDPNATGPGSPNDPTDPYTSWIGVAWSAGDTYLQKRGTTTSAKIILGASGTENARITLGAYYNIDVSDDPSQPKPIIDLNNLDSHCILANGKSHITIENFIVKNSTSNGITSYSSSGNGASYVIVRNCEAYDCVNNGVYLGDISGSGGLREGAIIENCYAESCGKHGVAIAGWQDRCIIRNCIVYNVCLTGNGWGIYMRPHSQRQTGTWTLYSGTIYNYDLTGSLADGETLTRVVAGGAREITARELTSGTYNSLAIGEWAQSGNTLQINIDEDPNPFDPINIEAGPCTNGLIENCVAIETKNADGLYDGVGIGQDISCTDSTIRNCLSIGNTGGGYSIHLAKRGTIHNCISINNAKGVNLAGVLNYENRVFNNTLINNDSGVWITRSEQCHIYNNIIIDSTIGIDGDVANEALYGNNVFIEDVNLLYNNGTNIVGSISLSSTDILADPLLDDSYLPASTSPCLNAGTSLISRYDAYSKPNWGNHIGAVWPTVKTNNERRDL